MNQEMIKSIIEKGNIDTTTHSGSYELTQKAVEFYAGIDPSKIMLADLTMLFRFCINKGNKQPQLDEKIDESNLSADQKASLKDICKKWSYKNLGMFGSGSMMLQFSRNADKDAVARVFIKMLIDISKLTNDNAFEMFDIVKKALSGGISGMRAGIASQILHYMNPEVFPVLNNIGQEGFEKKLGLTGFKKISEVASYADNAKLIYDFREKYMPNINFRTIDASFWEYQEDEPTKFKRLLNWFVTQLTRNLKIDKGELSEKSLVGKGDNGTERGTSFRKNYDQWRLFEDLDLDITLGRGMDVAKPKSNYVHMTGMLVSIYPIYDDNKTGIVSLQIGVNKVVDGYEPISIAALGIMSDGKPTEKLEAFLESFREAVRNNADIASKVKSTESTDDIVYWLGGASINVGDISKDCIKGRFYAIHFINKDIKNAIGDIDKLTEIFDEYELSSHERNMFNLFFQMKAGDKIAIKSTWSDPKTKISYLFIKAIGTVTASASEAYKFDFKCGHTIPVEWTVIEESPRKMTNIGNYSKTICRLQNAEHINRIFFEGEDIVETQSTEYNGENIILYGVPGSGKSFTIKREIAKTLDIEPKDTDAVEANYASLCKGEQITRVVFHPDYTYSDFTGQILPKTKEGKVDYQFTPGPFTRILKAATYNSQKPYFLVIEEINRGNAAAIFGDLFQLLDRVDYESEYRIDSIEIGKSVHDIETDDVEIPKIFIPRNLWLLATMNTSDQNVFTLDTAFQRRWDMRLIFNEFLPSKHDFIIEGTGKTWREFAETINKLLESGGSMTSEDKRLGAWFIKPDLDDGQAVSKKRFANKVLKYLWDDAFKFSRDRLFNTAEYPTLEKVIKYFDKVKSDQGFGNLFKGSLFQSNEAEASGKTEASGEVGQ